VLVMTVSTIMYTRFGATLSDIGFWTSILGFAWVIKPLWGPLVDLYWTKRRWTILMQILIGVLLGVVAFSLRTEWWWAASLLALSIVALFSATHDIAADGFYMDALDEKQQSFFVGIRSTFYRIAMIFGQGVLLIIAGMIEQRTGPAPSELIVTAAPAAMTTVAPAVQPEVGFVKFEPNILSVDAGGKTTVTVALAQQPETTRTVTLRRVSSSFLAELFPFGAERQVELADKAQEVLKFNQSNWNVPQQVVIKADSNLKENVTVPFKAASGNIPLTWALCFGGVGMLLLSLGIYHTLALPKPENDGSTVKPTTPFPVALLVMAGVVIVPVAAYWGLYTVLNKLLVMIAPSIWGEAIPSKTFFTFLTIGLIVVPLYLLLLISPVRRILGAPFRAAARISHVPFDEVFISFFAKPYVGRMIAFLLLYRLGEALLVKMSGPFLIKPVAEGGMGLSTQEYGLAYGTVGILALTAGGILGGIVASRYGLKRWILPMCLAINVPDALYVYLAYYQPPEFWKVLLCVSGQSFGYGFGFTAYMLYMLYIAGSGEHKTSHFALCTGFMALGMMLPGMVSGDIVDSLTKSDLGFRMGWTWFFIIVCIATIPGFIMLALIPLDKEFGRRSGDPSRN